MKKALISLKNNKYISLFIALMLAFVYMGGTRKYIYDNCSKIFSFERMGSGWFNLSIGITVLMAVAVCIGVAVMFLFRKKITMNVVIFGYGIVGIISILTLIFTPYNLQLLSPATHMDAFATLTMIAVMVFGLIATVILSVAISAHILLAVDNEKSIATVAICIFTAISAIFASLAVVFDWSLKIYISIFTLSLIIVYAINSVTKSERDINICVKEAAVNKLYIGIIAAVVVLAMIAVLTSSCVAVEKMYNFNL